MNIAMHETTQLRCVRNRTLIMGLMARRSAKYQHREHDGRSGKQGGGRHGQPRESYARQRECHQQWRHGPGERHPADSIDAGPDARSCRRKAEPTCQEHEYYDRQIQEERPAHEKVTDVPDTPNRDQC